MVPRVVQLVTYDRMPRSAVRLTRRNIFLRDGHTCQYCARRATPRELNLDHVMPRSRGGPMTWENVVCSCRVCNLRKGGRLAHDIGMHPSVRPHRPTTFQLQEQGRKFPPNHLHDTWLDYLYWDVELET